MILFNKKACANVKNSVIMTLVEGSILKSNWPPIRLSNAGSNKNDFSSLGKCKNAPKHKKVPIIDTYKILIGENFLCWLIIIYQLYMISVTIGDLEDK